MIVNIITNLICRKGLYHDAMLISGILGRLGHWVQLVEFSNRECSHEWTKQNIPHGDLTIHLEVVDPVFFKCSPRHWWIPNAEWTYPSYLQHALVFEHVLCKTEDAYRLMKAIPHRILTGFLSRDQRLPVVPRERAFFHACRGSQTKGTSAIKEAWKQMGKDAPPLVIANGMDPETFRREQNRCAFHLCPSEYEGFGHCIHEALSVGGVVITTDAPPMNETPGVSRVVPVASSTPYNLARLSKVTPEGIIDAVQWAMSLSDADIYEIGCAAREAFEAETEAFSRLFVELLA